MRAGAVFAADAAAGCWMGKWLRSRRGVLSGAAGPRCVFSGAVDYQDADASLDGSDDGTCVFAGLPAGR